MNMKCKTLLAAAAAGLVIGSTAQADMMADVHPYVGAALSYNMPSYKSDAATNVGTVNIKRNKLGFGVHGGARICEYGGVEIGYDQVLKAKDKNNGARSGKIQNIYLDAMGYFAASPEINLIGAVGVGQLKQKTSGFTLTESKATKKTSYRIGLGAEYKFDENVSARLMVRHQKGNKKFLKNMNSVALGVAYTF